MHSSRMRTVRNSSRLLLGGGEEGVPAPGVPAPGGGGIIPACTAADPPPVNRITDMCKNITFATLLWMVKFTIGPAACAVLADIRRSPLVILVISLRCLTWQM